MKILVPLKRVPDPDTRIRVKPDGSGIETEGVNYAINPFDAIALEEALRIEEKAGEIDIVVVSIGGAECAEQLRTGLAMGADRALLVRADGDLDPLAIAKVLAALYQREQPDFVLMGKQAIDDDSNQVGQMLAAILGIGQATFVSELELLDNNTQARCGRETDAGIERVVVKLPAIITTDLRLNEPRYVSLPGIMRARRKPLEEITLADLGVNVTSCTHVLSLEPPPKRKAGVKVSSVEELVDRLKNEAKVI
ncbi:MAG: electron transfer flavoprotein subunit beta/FixA family protein [Abditibacteriales bacterium]|nr:electron transfer flavoprotein subunit beta/FixA family protein [Abditibacteriales bacterium]MDW8364501.1 electron transfer flavoprotein subunit beta/FixA family protein [Abditibacteriales bacterium]